MDVSIGCDVRRVNLELSCIWEVEEVLDLLGGEGVDEEGMGLCVGEG